MLLITPQFAAVREVPLLALGAPPDFTQEIWRASDLMVRFDQREGRILSAGRVEAHLLVSSFSNLLSARLCRRRAIR
jgi:hypothetical protein